MGPTDTNARVTKMKDGRTHLAHKAEHAVGFGQGRGSSGDLARSRQGRHDDFGPHAVPAGEPVAELVGREAILHPDAKPKLNIMGIEEMVADKGHHSGAALELVRKYQVRSCIPERQQKGQRKWRARPASNKRCTPTAAVSRAAMARACCDAAESWLNAASPIATTPVECGAPICASTITSLKRQLIHVAGFNLSLIFRKLRGAGTPREWNDRVRMLYLFLLGLFTRPQENNRRCRSMILRSRTAPAETNSAAAQSRSCGGFGSYTTG